MIRSTDPGAACQARRAAIDEAIGRVLDSNFYILGVEVETFEKEFAAFVGVPHALGVASGTDAIELALRALEIGPGDAVLTVSHTSVATICGIERAGAIPVLADVDPRTFTLCPVSAARCLRSYSQLKFKAILPVHLYGQMAPMDQVMALAQEYNLSVVEDCSQAHEAAWQGRSAGSWGDVGTFSFYPTKNLGALGDGGAVVTSSPALATKMKALRQYGWVRPQFSELRGINSRLDELQAAILRVQLLHLSAGNQRRKEIAAQYDAALREVVATPWMAPGCTAHAWHQYTIRCIARTALQSFLAGQQIASSILYPFPVHLQPAYQGDILLDPEGLPETERIVTEILSLPIYPEMPDADVATVIDAIRSFNFPPSPPASSV